MEHIEMRSTSHLTLALDKPPDEVLLDDSKTPKSLQPKDNDYYPNSPPHEHKHDEDDIWKPGRDKVFHLHLPETHRQKWNLVGHLREFYIEEGRKKLEISWVDDRNHHAEFHKKLDHLVVPEKAWLKSHPNTKLWYELSERIEDSKREHEPNNDKLKIDTRPRNRWFSLLDQTKEDNKLSLEGSKSPRTNLADAKTFLQRFEARMQQQIYTSSNSSQYENYFELKDRAMKYIAEQLRQDIVQELAISVVEEMFAYHTLALDFVGKGVLRGLLGIDDNNKRFLKASGKLLVLRGAMEDFCTNRNDCLGAQERHAKALLEALQVHSLTDLVRKLDRSLSQSLQQKPLPSQVRKKQKAKPMVALKSLQPRVTRHIPSIAFDQYEGYIDSRMVAFIQQMEDKHTQQISAHIVERVWDWPKEKFGRITATLVQPDHVQQTSLLVVGTDTGRLYCWEIPWLTASQVAQFNTGTKGSSSNSMAVFIGSNRVPAKEDRVAITDIRVSPTGPRFLLTLNVQDHLIVWNLEELFTPVTEEDSSRRKRGFFSCSIFPKPKNVLFIEKLFDFESAELSFQSPSNTVGNALFHEDESTFLDQVKKYFGKVDEVDDRLPTAICFHAIANSRQDCTSVLVGTDDGMILKLNLDYVFQSNRHASINKPCVPFVEKEFVNPYVSPEHFILRTSAAKAMTSTGDSHSSSTGGHRPGNRVFREFLHYHRCKVVLVQVIDTETCDVLSMDEEGHLAIWKYDPKYFQNVGWFTPWKTGMIDLEWVEYVEKDQETESVDSKEHDEVMQQELRSERLVVTEEVVYPTTITTKYGDVGDEEDEEDAEAIVPTLSLSIDAWDDGLSAMNSPMSSPGRHSSQRNTTLTKRNTRKGSLLHSSFLTTGGSLKSPEDDASVLEANSILKSPGNSPRSSSKQRKSVISTDPTSPTRQRSLDDDGEVLLDPEANNASSKKSKTYFSKSPSMFRKSIVVHRDNNNISNQNSLDEGDLLGNSLSMEESQDKADSNRHKLQNPKRIIKFTKTYQPLLDEVNEEWLQYKVSGYLGIKRNPSKQKTLQSKDIHWEKMVLLRNVHKLKLSKHCMSADGIDFVVMCQVLDKPDSSNNGGTQYVMRSLALPALSFREHYIHCKYPKGEEIYDIACGAVMLETLTRLLFVLSSKGLRCFSLSTALEVSIAALQTSWQAAFKKFIPKRMTLCSSQRVLFLYSAQQSRFETIFLTHHLDQHKRYIKDQDEDPRFAARLTQLQGKIQEQNRILAMSSEVSKTSWQLIETKLKQVAQPTILKYDVTTPAAEDISTVQELIEELIDLSIDESETKWENRQRRQRIIEVYGRDLGYIDPTKWPPVKYSKLQLLKQERKKQEAKVIKEQQREQDQQALEWTLMAQNDYRALSKKSSVASLAPLASPAMEEEASSSPPANIPSDLDLNTAIPSPPKDSPVLPDAPLTPQQVSADAEDDSARLIAAVDSPLAATTPKPLSPV